MPFTMRLKGNVDFTLTGTMASYIAALGIVPFAFFIFLADAMVSPKEILTTMAQLVAVPLGISQLLRKTGIAQKIEKYRGHIVNWGFFVVVYTVTGLNRDLFLERPDVLLETSIIGFISTFVIAFASEYILKRIGMGKRDRVSMTLLATRKNYGLAAAIALAVIGPEAAMPSAVASIFNIIHFIWYSHRQREED
jgi:BASS family bile acid:Na+ symporter